MEERVISFHESECKELREISKERKCMQRTLLWKKIEKERMEKSKKKRGKEKTKSHFLYTDSPLSPRRKNKWFFNLKVMKTRIGKIPGIIFSESKYLGYLPWFLLEVNTFLQGGIGYYPYVGVFTEVFTFKISFPTLIKTFNSQQNQKSGMKKSSENVPFRCYYCLCCRTWILKPWKECKIKKKRMKERNRVSRV